MIRNIRHSAKDMSVSTLIVSQSALWVWNIKISDHIHHLVNRVLRNVEAFEGLPAKVSNGETVGRRVLYPL